MSDVDDVMSLTNYAPEILGGLIVGSAYGIFMWQWSRNGLGVAGEFVLFTTIIVALITVFGVDRIEKAVSIWREK